MQILFLILKIIGILFGVCILLLFSTVAVPVRYRAHAQVYEKAEGMAVFSWLFHIVDLRIWYGENGVTYKLRIFGIPIGLKKEKRKKTGKKSKKNHRRKRGAKQRKKTEDPIEEKPVDKIEQEAEVSEDPVDQKETTVSDDANQSGQKSRPITQDKKRKSRRKNKKKRTKRRIWSVRRVFEDIRQRISAMMTEAATTKEKVQNIKNMISDETNRNAVWKLWQELQFLMRHYFPRKVTGELAFGTGDPGRTGQVLGALSVIPFWARYKINIYPDFEAEEFFVNGKLQMKGYIRLWHLLLSAIRSYRNREIKRLLKRIRT